MSLWKLKEMIRVCALFGIHDYSNSFSSRQKNIILSVLSQECQVRGTDATGIAFVRNKRLEIYKRPIPAYKMRYNLPSNVKTVMGHTRMATQGSEKSNYNNHPFYGRVRDDRFVLAHNGILHGEKDLRQSLHLPKTHIQTDSYVAVQIIEKENRVTFDSLTKMAETVRGSFAFTVLDKNNNLYFIRGDNPICIYHFADRGFCLYASTEEILQKSLMRLGLNKYCFHRVPVEMGDIVRVDGRGDIDRSKFKVAEYYLQRYIYYYPQYDYDNGWGTVPAPVINAAQDNDYLAILKNTARLYGHTADDIDELMMEGWTVGEIEQLLFEDIYEQEEDKISFSKMGVYK